MNTVAIVLVSINVGIALVELFKDKNGSKAGWYSALMGWGLVLYLLLTI